MKGRQPTPSAAIIDTRHVLGMESPVYGLAVAVVATGSSVNHQLGVAGMDVLTIFDSCCCSAAGYRRLTANEVSY